MGSTWGVTARRSMAAAVALVACAASAHAADRRYPVQDFDRIIVEGPFTVRLTTGRTTTAMATGSPRALDGVSVETQGQTLRIRRNTNAWGGYPGAQAEAATIVIATRQIRSARLIGPGSLEISGLPGLRVDLALEGSGRIAVTGASADTLTVAVRGAGSVSLAGRAGVFTADVQGSGGLEGSALTAQNATLTSGTSGDISLNALRTARVTAMGRGRVTVTGSAACSVSNAGAAQVSCGRTAVAPPPARP